MVLLQQFEYSTAALLVSVIDYAYWILFGAIIASILFSWFPSYPSSSIMQAVYDAVRSIANPILMPIRSRVPMLQLGGFGIDLSPIIAIIGLQIGYALLEIMIKNFIKPITG